MKISEHSNSIIFLNELKNKNLISCSADNFIKIFHLNFISNSYDVKYQIKAHNSFICKVIELKNGNLFSCSYDKTVKIWDLNNNNNNFCVFSITNSDFCTDIIEYNNDFYENNFNDNFNNSENFNSNNNENNNYFLVGLSFIENSLFLWNENLEEKYLIKNIESSGTNKELLIYNNNIIIGGEKHVYLININDNCNFLVKNFEINFNIHCIEIINKNILIFGDQSGNYYQFSINNNNLSDLCEKNKIFKKKINYIIKSNDNNLISFCADKTLKIYEIKKII